MTHVINHHAAGSLHRRARESKPELPRSRHERCDERAYAANRQPRHTMRHLQLRYFDIAIAKVSEALNKAILETAKEAHHH